MKLDDQDIQLLRLLQDNCRMANAELAERAGLSPSACWRRVRALEEAGAIRRYGAELNAEVLGLGFQAIVHVHLVRHDARAVSEFLLGLETREEVQECYATTGNADYHLRIQCRDLEAYNRFLEDFLFRQTAVQSAQTNVVLKELKRSGRIALR